MRSSTSSAVRARLTKRVASSECPPRAKKSSSTVTDGTPRTSAKIPQSTSSCGVRGALPSLACHTLGAGRARWSSLPVTVSGRASTATTADGTMYSGSCPPVSAAGSTPSTASRATPARGTTYPTSRRSPGRSSRTTAAACAMSGWARRAASTSTSSIRKPRTFTWVSTRPANSSRPSGAQRARSPVRYMRSPGAAYCAAYGSATKRCAVRPARCAYPRASPVPATYSSPTTPGGTRPRPASSTYVRVPSMGRPIGGDTAVRSVSVTAPHVAKVVASVGP